MPGLCARDGSQVAFIDLNVITEVGRPQYIVLEIEGIVFSEEREQ